MLEFIGNHLDAIASTIAIVGSIYTMLKIIMEPRFKAIDSRLDAVGKEITSIKEEIKEIKAEMQRFHTRLTWLDGYIARTESPLKKRKGE